MIEQQIANSTAGRYDMGENEAFIAITVLAASVFVIMWLRERQRTSQLAEIAQSLGREFLAKCSPRDIPGHEQLPLFSQGRSAKVINLLRSPSPSVEPDIFGYRYTDGGGKKFIHLHANRCAVSKQGSPATLRTTSGAATPQDCQYLWQ